MRDWMRSELAGKSDGAAKVFEYLERHGITREDAVTPREDREDSAGMGVGVALGLVAAIPTGGLSLVGGVLGVGAGDGIIGRFFHKGLKMTDEDAAHIADELDAGHAAVGVLTRGLRPRTTRLKAVDHLPDWIPHTPVGHPDPQLPTGQIPLLRSAIHASPGSVDRMQQRPVLTTM